MAGSFLCWSTSTSITIHSSFYIIFYRFALGHSFVLLGPSCSPLQTFWVGADLLLCSCEDLLLLQRQQMHFRTACASQLPLPRTFTDHGWTTATAVGHLAVACCYFAGLFAWSISLRRCSWWWALDGHYDLLDWSVGPRGGCGSNQCLAWTRWPVTWIASYSFQVLVCC